MIIDPKVRAMNEQVLNGLVSDNPMFQKESRDGINGYLRIRAREDGFARSFYNVKNVTPADLDRQASTVKPVIVRDMEPNSAPAYSVPFGTTPINTYMGAPRYQIMFDRLMSPRYTADVANLLTYDFDIRQVFNDLLLKDMLHEEDRKFLLLADSVCGGLNDTNPVTNTRIGEVGALGYVEVGAVNRNSLMAMRKGLPSTNRHLTATSALVNNVTIWDFAALDRIDAGELSEDMLLHGFTEREFLGTKWKITIKTDLVPDNIVYQFAAAEWLGDFCVLEDVTVSTKTENFMFEMFGYEMLGATLKNAGGVCKTKFSGTYRGWTVASFGSTI